MCGTHVREIEKIAGLEIMSCLGPVLHAGSIGFNQAKVERLPSCVLRNSLRQRATNVKCGSRISVGTFDEAGGYEAEIQLRRSTNVGGSYAICGTMTWPLSRYCSSERPYRGINCKS